MLTVSCLMVAGMAILSWKSGNDGATANKESADWRRIQDVVEDLLATMRDAETGQRGYLLTGHEQYLEPYNSAAAQAGRILSELRDATSSSADQSERVGNSLSR